MKIDNEVEVKQNLEVQTVMEEHQEENENVDLSKFSKSDLLQLLSTVKVEENFSKASSLIKSIKLHFDNLTESERNIALNNFIESGADAKDFDFKKDEVTLKFEKAYEQLRDKITKIHSNLEKEKENNLLQKNVLLDKLRTLIASEETTTSINTLKDIQSEWKKIGQIPANHTQELWANFNALIDRFYNNRSIYFELKELDRKKNLEAKIELCEKAEKLSEVASPTQAIKDLKVLHEEYKHIGPVPKEDQEVLWNRFKLASDKVYEKRNQQYEKQKLEQEENFSKKLELVDKLEAYVQFNSERIDDWKVKTTEVLAIQEEWKKIGLVPLEKSKEISKKFWSACKTYFQNKDHFFKALEQKKEENLKLKQELCVQAEQLKESTDYIGTANVLKELQKKWDAVGPVPIKQKEAIFKRFKEACDLFFKKKREYTAETEKEYQHNLLLKEQICAEIEKLAQEKIEDSSRLKALQEQWKSIGFVPRTEMKTIQEKYNKALNSYIKTLDSGTTGNKNNLKFTLEISALKNTPDASKKVHRKESDIHKRIQTLKGEIDRYRTNIEFFGRSKNAELLKKDIENKIEASGREMKKLEEQLKIIRQS